MSTDAIVTRLAAEISRVRNHQTLDLIVPWALQSALTELALSAKWDESTIDPGDLLRILHASRSFTRARELELHDTVRDAFALDRPRDSNPEPAALRR